MPKTVAVIEKTPLGFGVSFPDFPLTGTSAASVEDLLVRAEATLDSYIEALLEDGREFPRLRSIDEILADPEHEELLEDIGPVTYAMVEVPMPSKSIRINVTLDESLLERIDRKAAAQGESRSGFLAAAARARLAG